MSWTKNFTGWDSLCYAAGGDGIPEKCPPPMEKPLRIYTMRFCPFSERAVLVASARSLDAEIITINLKDKPEWFTTRCHPGSTPTLDVLGKNKPLTDSLVVAEYLDSADSPTSAPSTLPADPWERAHEKLQVNALMKIHSCLYKWWENLDDQEAVDSVKTALSVIQAKIKDGNYLSGNDIGWTDYMLWPWLERALMMEPAGKLTIGPDNFPELAAYIAKMKARPEIAAVARSPELHWQHVQNHFIHKKPDFDLGIPKE